MTGLNIFTNPNPADNTFGTFSAGISGHTTDISLITSLVTSDEYLSSSIFVIVGAFIWMIQYYHHSIREIMLAGLVNCKNKSDKENMINLVSLLYYERSDKYRVEDIYDKIYKFLNDKLETMKVDTIKDKISSDNVKLLIKDYYENIENKNSLPELNDKVKDMMKDLKDIKPLMEELKIVVPDSDC